MPPVDTTAAIENVQKPYSTSKPQTVIEQKYNYNKIFFLHLGPFEFLKDIEGKYSLAESNDTTNPQVFAPEQTITIKEIVNKIRSVFGLNAIQVAKLIGVSRPSLYNHISNKEIPKDISTYKAIYDLAIHVDQVTSSDLKRGLKTVLIDGKTLLAHLNHKPISEENIIHVAKQIDLKLLKPQPERKGLSVSEQRMKSHSISKSG